MTTPQIMKRIVVAAVVVLAGLGIPAQPSQAGRTPPSGAVVRSWNQLALQTIRETNGNDATAARTYAMVHVAIYDAVNGLAPGASRRAAAMLPPTDQARGNAEVAAASAAHDVLVGLYPARAAIYDAQLTATVNSAGSRDEAERGRRWGARVAAAVLSARTNDGSTPEPAQPGGTGNGQFRDAWSPAYFRHLAPFAIDDPQVYVGEGPPALESVEYAAAFHEVKLLGDKARTDAAKLDTYKYWALGSNTTQPPGAWLQVAEVVSTERSLSLSDTARLFALEAMAMVDTVAPTYETKYEQHFWRPQTAIREGGIDPNPDTPADASPPPGWEAWAGSPGSSPEHWSGHSSFSAAAAEVLARFFCQDDISFTLLTDQAPGARTFPSFSAAAAEAGRSRVLGGIHFEFSNQAGLAAGRAVADEVLDHELLVMTGRTHHGACPR